MKILVAEDELVSRRLLQTLLAHWGHEVVTCINGREALAQLQSDSPPSLAVLDWLMPEIDGVNVCRQVRVRQDVDRPYLIILTTRGRHEDIVEGLEAGADDYVIKPFNSAELRARIRVGARMLELQRGLSARVQELEAALHRVRQLEGLLPMCSYCKKIRDDQGSWQRVESYISARTDAQFSHGICPECYQHSVEPMLRDLEQGGGQRR